MSNSLPRLQSGSPLVDENGLPTSSFHIWWDNFAAAIEAEIGALTTATEALAAAQAAAHPKGIWASGTAYSVNDMVYYNGTFYVCTTALTSTATPDVDTGHWEKYSPASQDDLQDGSTYARLPVSNSTGTGTSRRALIDLSQSHLNKNTNQLTDGAGLGNTSIVINELPLITVHADSSGNIKSGELPTYVTATASNGITNVTTSGTWSVTATTGVTCSIGASTGILTISAMTVSETYIPIQFTYSGITRATNVHVLVVSDPPTSSGSSSGTSSSGSTATLGNTTGSSYDTTNAVSSVIYCAAGSGGNVALAAPINYKSTDGTSTVTATGKWQYNNAGTWTDVGTEVTGTSNAYVSLSDGGAPYKEAPGQVSVSVTKTGLTSGTTYGFRFIWHDAGTGNCRYVSGTITATGS